MRYYVEALGERGAGGSYYLLLRERSYTNSKLSLTSKTRVGSGRFCMSDLGANFPTHRADEIAIHMHMPT